MTKNEKKHAKKQLNTSLLDKHFADKYRLKWCKNPALNFFIYLKNAQKINRQIRNFKLGSCFNFQLHKKRGAKDTNTINSWHNKTENKNNDNDDDDGRGDEYTNSKKN